MSETEILKRYEIIEFKLYVQIKQNEVFTSKDSIYLDSDYWKIKTSTTNINNSFQVSFELIHIDKSRSHKGTWFISLLGLEAKNNMNLNECDLKRLTTAIIPNMNLFCNNTSPSVKIQVKVTVHHDNIRYHSIGNDLQRNYDDIELSADVKIIAVIDNSESISAHKAILILRSPVFKAMFNHDMTESSSNQIKISDFDVTTIRRMVEFMYKDTFTDIDRTSYEDFVSLLAISNKYQIIGLKDASASYLMKMLTVVNVAEVRHYSNLYDSSSLLNACLNFIKANAEQLFKDDTFLLKCSG